MLPVPKKFFVTAVSAEGKSRLNAFDNALLAARIGNVNLLRVSSILPTGAEYDPDLQFPAGALVPTAYGSITSDVQGELIAAAVGVAVDPAGFGVIMEYSGKCSRDEAYRAVEEMLAEAFAKRGLSIKDKKIKAVEHRVDKVGCCLAAVPLWY
ncbi:MAG: arginine decarboxylase, pyruvoyl-dependent [Peptococcaceae bacterium]|nr:arginine decarboxylase, pyruvoyl-dependent [Peptococcaceae bacterium]